jgi:hypothetical protein
MKIDQSFRLGSAYGFPISNLHIRLAFWRLISAPSKATNLGRLAAFPGVRPTINNEFKGVQPGGLPGHLSGALESGSLSGDSLWK